ncbi:MAG: helix-turn-helix transcriptional regulator [Clostridia bacterium]|nr:helix-turn-helix transcriptional regulator [Clostridia bacterium]
MIKVNYAPNRASIIISENQKPQQEINVMAMGNSTLDYGYDYNATQKFYVLHFLIAGRGTALGQPIEGPMGFVFTPQKTHCYCAGTDTNYPRWEQFWIRLNGTDVEKHLAAAGFPTEPQFFEMPYHDQLKTFFHFLFRNESYFDCDDYYYFLSKLNRLFSIHSYTSAAYPQKKNLSNQYVKDAVAYIKENYAEDIKLEDISDALHISSKYLYKLFKSELGISPMKYLNGHRIICAQSLLSSQNLQIKAVAKEVGFNDPDYFCHVFKKHSNGVSPTEYKKNIK